jgi:hypothetical protein
MPINSFELKKFKTRSILKFVVSSIFAFAVWFFLQRVEMIGFVQMILIVMSSLKPSKHLEFPCSRLDTERQLFKGKVQISSIAPTYFRWILQFRCCLLGEKVWIEMTCLNFFWLTCSDLLDINFWLRHFSAFVTWGWDSFILFSSLLHIPVAQILIKNQKGHRAIDRFFVFDDPFYLLKRSMNRECHCWLVSMCKCKMLLDWTTCDASVLAPWRLGE